MVVGVLSATTAGYSIGWAAQRLLAAYRAAQPRPVITKRIELGKGVGLRGAELATLNVMVRLPTWPNAPLLTVPVNVMELAVNEVSPKVPELSAPELNVTLLIVG